MHDPKLANLSPTEKRQEARKRLGRFLKDHRQDQGLSQQEMADKLGMDQATVSRWERGGKVEGNPSHAYGLRECYPSAPLDPEDRETHFAERNANMGGAWAKQEEAKRLNAA